ncbi:MAG: hypothetical protein H7Z40_09370 [Phycisphaerae bacterium]|nr:hypothetical protein [Gemmatimonadaceae bacterium]
MTMDYDKWHDGIGYDLELLQQATLHPPEILDELFRGLLVRRGEIATNFAGMLAFVHSKADSAFDWNHRPLFLKFKSDGRAERRKAFDELCVMLELDAAAVLTRISA